MYLLTPMEIHEHQFKKAFRGYNENEVDDFLDRIVDDFEKLLRENERLKNQIYASEKELEHFRKLEKNLNDTLMMAQRTADDVVTAARRNAEDIKANTERECKSIREKAELEAKRQIDGAAMKRNAILAEYDKFVREKNSFLMKLRTILESELTITVQMLEDVPKVSESVKEILDDDIPAPVAESQTVNADSVEAETVAEVKPVDESAPAIEDEPVKIYKPVAKSEVVKESEPVAESEVAVESRPVRKFEPVIERDTKSELPNLVDVSTKPVAKNKTVTDETRTYEPVKSGKVFK